MCARKKKKKKKKIFSLFPYLANQFIFPPHQNCACE